MELASYYTYVILIIVLDILYIFNLNNLYIKVDFTIVMDILYLLLGLFVINLIKCDNT